jgi:hypothetical protein
MEFTEFSKRAANFMFNMQCTNEIKIIMYRKVPMKAQLIIWKISRRKY